MVFTCHGFEQRVIHLDNVCHCRFVPDLEDIVTFEELVTEGGLQKETVDAAK